MKHTPIRAELFRDDGATAAGLTVRSSSPILSLCRKLVECGHDPATPLDAYRANTLALHVRLIGEAANLRMDTARNGRPIFKRRESTAAAPPMRSNLEAAE